VVLVRSGAHFREPLPLCQQQDLTFFTQLLPQEQTLTENKQKGQKNSKREKFMLKTGSTRTVYLKKWCECSFISYALSI
jgi:hypothetical protein